MDVWHTIPVEEEELHEVSEHCLCQPSLIPEHSKKVEWMEGEIVFEHHPFSPLDPATESYVAICD